MNKVAEFYKVSKERFATDMGHVTKEFRDAAYNNIAIPRRATTGSAGYDFKAPFGFALEPGESIKIPTGIRVKIEDGWWLGCLPRSGLGFKYQVRLANTMGVIDQDYYGSSNEGHIFLKIVNSGDRRIEVSAGDGVAQGIFIPYGITYSDDTAGVRDGGMGSTDKK